jgi:hypothetical protein
MRALFLVGFLLASPALAWDPPDAQLDPTTGLIHTVDSTASGSDQVIRHTIDPGQGQPTVATITSGHADYSPHLAIDGNSVVHVVFQRALSLDQIRTVDVRVNGSLSTERLVSDADEDSRNASIVLFDALARVAYEIHDGGEVAIATVSILDEPDPIGLRTIVATTSFSGDVDVRMHAAEGHLWVTWVDASDSVGYSVFDTGSETWGSAQYQEVSDEDFATALERVEAAVLE